MALAAWQATIVDGSGNVQATAEVEVIVEQSGALAALFSDRDGATPLDNPFDADENGFARFYTAGGAYKITATLGSFSREWRHVPIGLLSELDAVDADNVSYDETLAEIAEGVTPENYAYQPGDSRRQAVTNDSTTDHTGALQDVLDAAAGMVPVHVYKTQASGYIRLTGRLTAPAGTHIILHDGVELRWTATAATGTTFLGAASRPGIEITGDNFRIEGKGTLRGPSSASYVQNEIAIFAKGTSTSARKSGLVVRDIEFLNWGRSGIVAQFVDNVDIGTAYVHDCGFAGVQLLSCTRFRLNKNHVKNITPGSGGFVYGLSCTHDDTDYDIDPDLATPRLVAHPFCIDGDMTANTVEDLPAWTGIDCHGGYEIRVARNSVYNCRIGISLAGSSGDAAAYAGENNSVLNNYCTTLKRDGSATTISATDRYGLIVAGGTTVRHSNVTVEGNTTFGYGDTVVTSYSLHAGRVRNAIIRGNTFLSWRGNAIYSNDGDGIIAENLFGGVASTTNACCVLLDTTTGSWNVTGNKHRPISGTASNEGLRVNNASNPRILLQGNDFDYATTPYANFDGTQTCCDSQITPQITVTGSPTSVDISGAGRAPRVRVYFNVGGASTVADFTNARVGQVIECYFPTTNVTTVDRTNSALAGGANFASTQFDRLVLECVNTSGTKFVESSRSANS